MSKRSREAYAPSPQSSSLPTQPSSDDADGYFEAYGDLSVHTLMLNDEPRMKAYVGAFETLADRIRGKVVMDVGCGTGVLSMLCARICQPAQILAVEATPSTARLAEALIRHNGLDTCITVVKSAVEQIDIGEKKVDVLVSEWMGFYLLHESMLDSVLYARDKFLKPKEEGGLLLPSVAHIDCAAVDCESFYSEHVDKWQNYIGLDFSPLGQLEAMSAIAKPQIYVVPPQSVMSDPVKLCTLDLWIVQSRQLDLISQSVQMPIKRAGVFGGVGVWFRCDFEDSGVTLDTSPQQPPSHWMQSVVFLGCRAPIAGEGVETVEARVVLRRPGGRDGGRMYDICVET